MRAGLGRGPRCQIAFALGGLRLGGICCGRRTLLLHEIQLGLRRRFRHPFMRLIAGPNYLTVHVLCIRSLWTQTPLTLDQPSDSGVTGASFTAGMFFVSVLLLVEAFGALGVGVGAALSGAAPAMAVETRIRKIFRIIKVLILHFAPERSSDWSLRLRGSQISPIILRTASMNAGDSINRIKMQIPFRDRALIAIYHSPDQGETWEKCSRARTNPTRTITLRIKPTTKEKPAAYLVDRSLKSKIPGGRSLCINQSAPGYPACQHF